MSSAPYQAVILAAGRGSRLSSHTHAIPKALLPIGPRSNEDATETNFLRRQVELLHDLGVEQIVIVIGTLGHMIEDEVKRWNIPVTLVTNTTPDIGTSGSLHSFQFAQRADVGILDGEHQTLLMDADIVYHPDALKLFLEAPARTSLLVASRHRGDSEEVCAYGSANAPRFLAKGLDSELAGGSPCVGEAAGIVKFAPQDHALALKTMDWLLGDPNAEVDSASWKGYGPARRATEHEELSQRFMHYGAISCVTFGEHIPFMECDDADEYRTVREEFYPSLLGIPRSK